MSGVLLNQFREHLAQLAQAEGAGLVAAIVLIVLILLICPAPKKRRIRASVYLLLIHLVLLALQSVAESESHAGRFFGLAALFFLLSSLGRSLFVFITQGVLRRSSQRLPRIFLDVIHGLIHIAAFLYTLSVAGVEPGSLLTGSALLTAIVGLSLKDSIGNLFSGLALEAQRPFEVGDWIQWDDHLSHIGQVVEINWRATRVVSLDAVEITVPHSLLGQGRILNFTKPNRWSRRSIYFHAPLEVPTHRVQQIVLEAIADSFGVLADPPPTVVTFAFDERGVQYWLRFFTVEFGTRDRVDGEVRDRVWYALDRAGIAIPPPRRQVVIEESTAQTQERERQEQVADRVRALRCVDFLAPLESASHEMLAALSRTVLYAPGETIIRQGEPGEELFIIRQGEVTVTLAKPGEEEIELARLGAGNFFGEMSLLTGEPRSATIRALKPCELLVVSKAAFARILEQSPALADQVSGIISHRSANLRQRQTEALRPENSSEEEWGSFLLKRIKEFFSI